MGSSKATSLTLFPMERLYPTAAILVIHSLGMLPSTARWKEPGASLLLSAKVCLCLVSLWWQNQNWAEETCSHADTCIHTKSFALNLQRATQAKIWAAKPAANTEFHPLILLGNHFYIIARLCWSVHYEFNYSLLSLGRVWCCKEAGWEPHTNRRTGVW